MVRWDSVGEGKVELEVWRWESSLGGRAVTARVLREGAGQLAGLGERI